MFPVPVFYRASGGIRHWKNICNMGYVWYFQNMKLPQNKSLSGLAQNMRNFGTKAEAVLWKYIKNKKGYGFQFHRQKNIGKYIVDFYCPRLGLVIEVDGNSHDNKYEYDRERDEYLKKLGLCVLHIDNDDVLFRTSNALFYVDTFIVHRINILNKHK